MYMYYINKNESAKVQSTHADMFLWKEIRESLYCHSGI